MSEKAKSDVRVDPPCVPSSFVVPLRPSHTQAIRTTAVPGSSSNKQKALKTEDKEENKEGKKKDKEDDRVDVVPRRMGCAAGVVIGTLTHRERLGEGYVLWKWQLENRQASVCGGKERTRSLAIF